MIEDSNRVCCHVYSVVSSSEANIAGLAYYQYARAPIINGKGARSVFTYHKCYLCIISYYYSSVCTT